METLILIAALAPARSSEGVIEAFGRSGPMAKLVLGLLLLFSLASWAAILARAWQFRRAGRDTRGFLRLFRESKKFSEVAAGASAVSASPLVGLFRAGYAEIESQVRAHSAGAEGGKYQLRSLACVERSLQRAVGMELRSLTRGQSLLATTASATPFIGLFGTVWGILVAFQQIGVTGSTSIVAVAPGIAEALINTAAGLAAAIPALIAYNHFNSRLRGLRAEMDDFALEFLNLAERNFS
jgi:biopolymer transport protein TolQ